MKRLSCRICGRQEVWGLLSSHAWGHTEDGQGRICPACVTKDEIREQTAQGDTA